MFFAGNNGLLNRTHDSPNLEQIRKVEEMIAYGGEYTWIDLEQSRERTRGKVNGGAVREFHASEDYPGSLQFKDWLLYIRRAEP